jgi:hypothetical protein
MIDSEDDPEDRFTDPKAGGILREDRDEKAIDHHIHEYDEHDQYEDCPRGGGDASPEALRLPDYRGGSLPCDIGSVPVPSGPCTWVILAYSVVGEQ